MSDPAIAGPWPPEEMERFLSSFTYERAGFLVDSVERLDAETHEIEGTLSTTRALAYSDAQRIQPGHPAHVSGPELVMATASLGSLHAWFFHGCRWDEGWAGFGSRIHRADFKKLVVRGPELRLCSRETRSRAGPKRLMMRLEFRFYQQDELVYAGDQSAMFILNLAG